MTENSFNITSNVPLPPNTKITVTVNEPVNKPPPESHILLLKNMNKTLQRYNSYELKTEYGTGLLKRQINLLVDIVISQHDKINYLENELKKKKKIKKIKIKK